MLFRNRAGMDFEVSDAIPGTATGLGLAVCDLVIELPHGKGRIIRRSVRANRRLKL